MQKGKRSGTADIPVNNRLRSPAGFQDSTILMAAIGNQAVAGSYRQLSSDRPLSGIAMVFRTPAEQHCLVAGGG
jgi:hypothetical protein